MKQIILLAVFAFTAISIQPQVYIFENSGQPISTKDRVKIDRVIQYETEFYKQFGEIDTIQIKLRLFAKKEAYQAYLKSNKIAKTFYHSGGMYRPKTKELLVLKPENANYLKIVYHETSHYLLHLVISKQPRWLSEGLAEYFENINLGKKKITHEIPPATTSFIKSMIDLKEIDLQDFILMKSKDFWKETITNESYPYRISHGIVYFLIEKDSEQFKQIVLKIKNGSASYDTINETYAGGFTQFEKDFIKYYLKK
ncbi:MAG: DUF1570 domain-containing protein [Prevotellaceae bacterium]|jgi:hypothetical protein|nr:DUF1570 domain-containing protein [Prevotellaceae bacterium]